MLLLRTEFNIDPSTTPEHFYESLLEWIINSPHYDSIRKEVAAKRNIVREFSVESETEKFVFTTGDNIHELGIELSSFSDGRKWKTRIVGNKSPTTFSIGIEVESDSENFTDEEVVNRKPYIIKMLSQKYGKDNCFDIVNNTPINLLDDVSTVNNISEIINNIKTPSLPIVYLSCDTNGRHVLNAERMARQLCGMAYVLVEPSTTFSHLLKQASFSRNVFGGAVGIYWPGQRRRWYVVPSSRDWENPKRIVEEVIEEVFSNALHKRLSENCSWDYLISKKYKRELDIIRAKGAGQLDEYVKTFDKDMEFKEKVIGEQKEEIKKLENKIKEMQEADTLDIGQEKEFYKFECASFVIDAIEIALRNISEDTRRYHMLKDILEQNEYKNLDRKEKMVEIKNTLRDYREMQSKTEKKLKQLGFSISSDGKHYKAIYFEDDRYVFAIPKTGGDHRGGKNMASEIISKCF